MGEKSDAIAYVALGAALARTGDVSPPVGWQRRVTDAIDAPLSGGGDDELELLLLLNAMARAALTTPAHMVLYDDEDHVPGAEAVVVAWAVGRSLHLEEMAVPGGKGPFFRVIRCRIHRSKVDVYCGEVGR